MGTSLGAYDQTENMGQVTNRISLTSSGSISMNPWNGDGNMYSPITINVGSNPLTKIEIVSALNSFNLTYAMYEYYTGNRPAKYNPKVYLSAVQSVANRWNFDTQNGQNWDQKSGSWPQVSVV